MNRTHRHHSRRRRGTILIIAMIVIFAIAAMVLTLGKQVRTESQAAANDVAAQKADAAERGAEQYVLSLLTDYADTIPTLTETDFTAVPVGDAYFWISRPDYGDSNNANWGLLDESGKLSLNTATADQLAALPNMTADLAAAIVAYRGTGIVSSDTSTTTDDSSGADITSGTTSGTSAAPTDNGDGTIIKNAPFETVDESMLVQGMTHDILYGTGGNAGAAAASSSASGGTNDWATTHGIFDYLTVWDTAPNTAADGTARVSFNAQLSRPDLQQLLQTYLTNATQGQQYIDAITTPARRGGGGGMPINQASLLAWAQSANMTQDDYEAISDYVTGKSTVTQLAGYVNLNTAPRDVLLALGTIAESDVDSMIAARPDAIAQYPNSIYWVKSVLTDVTTLGSPIWGRGKQFSADITAASGDGRGYRHVRVVVDTSTSPARIVYRHDLTDHGWPLDASILDGLKQGQAPGTTAASSNGTVASGGMH